MKKIFSKIFRTSSKMRSSNTDKINELFGNKRFLDSLGRTADILYEYDKKK